MSDLQCAARILVVSHGDAASHDADALTSALSDRRVALVYTSPSQRVQDSAEDVAAGLGVGCRVLPGLLDVTADESPDAAVQRYREALDEVADLHRGETVLLVSHRAVMSFALPRIAQDVPDELEAEHSLLDGDVVELLGDADGWSMPVWPRRTRT